ncbi:hypothetical protein [Streptomyces cinnamoneus]
MDTQRPTSRTAGPAALPDLVRSQPNLVGRASLMLAVASAFTATSFVGLPLSIGLAIAAMVCGSIGRGKVKRGESTEAAPASVGLVLGTVLAVFPSAVLLWLWVSLAGTYS